MSDAETPTSTSKGFSSFCVRGEHTTCRTVQARCTCSCHGRAGQRPPAPTGPPVASVSTLPVRGTPKDQPLDLDHPKERPMALAPEPAPAPVEYRCTWPGCDAKFKTKQAAGGHRSRAHRSEVAAASGTPDNPAGARVSAALQPEDDFDPWLVVLGFANGVTMRAKTVVLSTREDANQVAELLTELGHKPFTFRLSDAR